MKNNYSELAARLRELAARMPRPYDEDAHYSQREEDRLNGDIETVLAAAAALAPSSW